MHGHSNSHHLNVHAMAPPPNKKTRKLDQLSHHTSRKWYRHACCNNIPHSTINAHYPNLLKRFSSFFHGRPMKCVCNGIENIFMFADNSPIFAALTYEPRSLRRWNRFVKLPESACFLMTWKLSDFSEHFLRESAPHRAQFRWNKCLTTKKKNLIDFLT